MARPIAELPRAGEVRVIGIESCRALFVHRPRDIRRVHLIREVVPELSDVLAWCDKSRIPYHLVSVQELSALTETTHHDGICITAKRKRPATVDSLLFETAQKRGPLALVLLEGVKNPNNVGAITRVCSYFGVPYLLAAGQTAGFSMAAMRTAQGAAESVDLVPVDDLEPCLDALQERGFTIVATSSHGGDELGAGELPPRPLLLFGSENTGLSGWLLDRADLRVAIPGSGEVESLNIACASSVMLWEHWRRWRLAESAPAPPSTATERSRPAEAPRPLPKPPHGRRQRHR